MELIIEQILDELDRANKLHPAKFNSAHEGYAVLKEEVEEAWEAIKADDSAHAREEMIQVAAMAIKFLMSVGDST